MTVIPSINCRDFETATRQIRKAEKFFESEEGWIHIDVSDGKFTPAPSWGNPEELKSLELKLNVEVHLMIQESETVIESWLQVGVGRVIVHLQEMNNPTFILETCSRYGAEAMLAFDPSTSIESGVAYLKNFDSFQVLTVIPGASGQRQHPGWIEKIESLREKSPTATIEVDGGMNPENAKLAKDAGVNILVSGKYIFFGSPDPRGAYEKLKALSDNSV